MKKKLFGIAVALCVAMLLAACESGEKAIAQVEQAIADIGAVSLESEEAIAHAEELYSALDPNLQTEVTNARAIVDAREELELIKVLETITNDIASEKYDEALENINKGKEHLADLRKTHRYSLANKYTDLIKPLDERVLSVLSALRPENGEVFHNSIETGAQNSFTICADSSDAYIKLEAVSDPSKYALFYVRKYGRVTIDVEDGLYYLKYATGDHWFDQEKLFGSETLYAEADEILHLWSLSLGSSTMASNVTVTLDTVQDGNLGINPISPDEF